MARVALKKGSVVAVQNSEGKNIKYRIIGLKPDSGEKGASCLCYIAERLGNYGKNLVILKEFYPEKHLIGVEIVRKKDGSLEYKGTDKRYVKAKKRFEKGTDCLKRYVKKREFKDFLCCDEDVDIMTGNGTCYCENTFYRNSFSWKNMPKDVKMDEIFLTAIGTQEFLKRFHEEGKAYVDLKPEDILITASKQKVEYHAPLFFDFNSVLDLGKRYPLEEINATEEFKPRQFNGPDREAEVCSATENYTFAKVLENRINVKKETVTDEVRNEIDRLIRMLKNGGACKMSDEEINRKLNDIKEQIQEDECKFNETELIKKSDRFRWIHKISVAVIVLIYIVMTMILGNMSIHHFSRKAGAREVELAVILFVLITFLTLLKVLTAVLAAKVANSTVVCKYFHTDIRDGNYNTFKKGGRKYITLQDNSESNLERQRLRRVLWSLLGLAILMGFSLSVRMNAFPIFLAVGFLALIVFMYADLLPSHKWFFERYAKSFEEFRKIKKTARSGEALYYMNEYDESPDDPFNPCNEFYTTHNLNQKRIRDIIFDKCLTDSNDKNDVIKKLKRKFHYLEKMELVHDIKWEAFDLEFEPLQIQHIYKMAFDRLANQKLILHLAVLVATLAAVYMNFMVYTGILQDYFMLPEYIGLPAAISMMLIVAAISCFQVIYSGEEELLIAEMSYKSKYVISGALNNELIKDIGAGFILPLDIARGTYQYAGVVNTSMPGIKEQLIKRNTIHTIPLFQHRELSNRNRLAITIWLSFGILFAILVWYGRIYVLTPFLLITAIVSHILLYKYMLPVFGKKRIIRDIKKLEKLMG